MAQCLVTFAVISSIEPSSLTTMDGIMDPGLPPHTPYLGTPVVFPPGQRPVSFCFGAATWLDNPTLLRIRSISTVSSIQRSDRLALAAIRCRKVNPRASESN